MSYKNTQTVNQKLLLIHSVLYSKLFIMSDPFSPPFKPFYQHLYEKPWEMVLEQKKNLEKVSQYSFLHRRPTTLTIRVIGYVSEFWLIVCCYLCIQELWPVISHTWIMKSGINSHMKICLCLPDCLTACVHVYIGLYKFIHVILAKSWAHFANFTETDQNANIVDSEMKRTDRNAFWDNNRSGLEFSAH